MKVKNRQQLMDSFSEGRPEMREVVAERDDVAQVDEDSFKDFCCKKAATELVALLEGIAERYEKRGGPSKALRIRDVIQHIQNTEDCTYVKNNLQVLAKKTFPKGVPEGMKLNPEIERAREILDDLERCEGMKKSWFQQLKKEEETEKVAGAVTTSSAAHSHLFRPTYGKRRKRKKKKEDSE